MRPFLSAACLVFWIGFCLAGPGATPNRPYKDFQLVGAHNSYHVRKVGWLPQWYYNYASVASVLDQGIRYIELDFDPNLDVYHISFIDDQSSCPTLGACLGQVQAWSVAHPNHFPISIKFDRKGPANISAIDATIKNTVSPLNLFTRGNNTNTNFSSPVWPRLGNINVTSMLGKMIIHMEITQQELYPGSVNVINDSLLTPDIMNWSFWPVYIYWDDVNGSISKEEAFAIRTELYNQTRFYNDGILRIYITASYIQIYDTFISDDLRCPNSYANGSIVLRAEYFSLRVFDAFDYNNDGILTPTEIYNSVCALIGCQNNNAAQYQPHFAWNQQNFTVHVVNQTNNGNNTQAVMIDLPNVGLPRSAHTLLIPFIEAIPNIVYDFMSNRTTMIGFARNNMVVSGMNVFDTYPIDIMPHFIYKNKIPNLFYMKQCLNYLNISLNITEYNAQVWLLSDLLNNGQFDCPQDVPSPPQPFTNDQLCGPPVISPAVLATIVIVFIIIGAICFCLFCIGLTCYCINNRQKMAENKSNLQQNIEIKSTSPANKSTTIDNSQVMV
jgi:hypothetical protein